MFMHKTLQVTYSITRRKIHLEAGLTLLLHADLLKWSEEPLDEHLDFKAQTSSERKVIAK